jgi:hypothetical protein
LLCACSSSSCCCACCCCISCGADCCDAATDTKLLLAGVTDALARPVPLLPMFRLSLWEGRTAPKGASNAPAAMSDTRATTIRPSTVYEFSDCNTNSRMQQLQIQARGKTVCHAEVGATRGSQCIPRCTTHHHLLHGRLSVQDDG